MAGRVIHLVLIVSAQSELLRWRHQLVRNAGYHAMPARDADHALALARKARPSIVLADADLGDRRAFALLQALREFEALQGMHVVVLGVLTPEEHALVKDDPHAGTHQAADDDEAALVALLRDALAA